MVSSVISYARTGTAYDSYGNSISANTPQNNRVMHRINNLLTLDQSVASDVNNPELLPLNVQTGTDTLGNTTGYESKNSATISSSTTQAHSGINSAKTITPGSVTSEGIGYSSLTVSNGISYTTGWWVYAPAGATLYLSLYNGSGTTSLGATSFTGTGAWQYVTVSGTTIDTTVKAMVRTATIAQAITFYVDDVHLWATAPVGGFSNYTSGGGSSVVTSSMDYAQQGTKSIKVVTGGGASFEGVSFGSQSYMIPSTAYTFSVWVLGTNGVGLRTRMYNSVSGWTNQTLFTCNGSWQQITMSLTGPSSGTNTLYVVTQTQQATTFYVDTMQVEANSTATAWSPGQSYIDSMENGLLVEEATTNLLTANQSTCGDTLGNITGFVSINSATITTTTSNPTPYQGTNSIQVVTPGAVTNEGVTLNAVTTVNGNPYNNSFYINAPVGSLLKAIFAATTINIVGTGTWQYISLNGTVSGTSTALYIETLTPENITFNIDMIQIEQKAYPTSWTLGGTTRNAVTCTIPSSVVISDVSNYANYLTVNQSNIETNTVGLQTLGTGTVTLTRDTTTFYQGTASAKLVCDGTISGQGLSTEAQKVYSNGANQHWTVSGRVKGIAGTTVVIGLREFDSGSNFLRETDSTSFTLTGGWDLLNVTLTTGTNTSYVAMNIVTNSTENITFNVDALMMEARPHLDPWIVGGSQVSNEQGTIEFDLFVDTSSVAGNTTSEPTSFIISGSYGGIAFIHYSSVWEFYSSDVTGSTISKTTPSTQSQGWHHFACSWSSNYLKLYVDGVLIGSIYAALPQGFTTFHIGNSDTLIRNFCVSNTQRTDSNISNRATNGYTVDNHVTFSAGLTSDLSDILQVILSDGNQAWTDNPQVSVKPTVTDSNKAFVDSISVGSKFTISDSDKSWLDSLLVKNKLTIADNDLSWLDTLLVKSKVSISDANSLWNEIISIASKLKITDSDLAWSDILTIKNKFSIPDNDLNWVDLITLKILSAISDSNFLWQDNLLIKVAFMLADGNCCLDTVENISIASSLTIPDAGEVSETLSVLIQFIINQSGTVEDIVDILNKFTLFDIGQATDLPVVQGKISLQDSGTDIENVLMKSTLSLNDLGFLRDIVNLNNLFTLYDSGIIKEKLLFLIGLLIEDDATDSEAISLLSSLLIKDFGYSVDNAVVNTTLTINDIGVTIEQAIVQVGVLLVDEGYGLDEIVKIFLTEYYDLIVTLEKEYDVIVNVEDIFDAIITYSKQANAKVIK